MDKQAEPSDYNDVKEVLLTEGLHDWIYPSSIHSRFEFDDHTPKRPVSEAQQLTLRLIRELVTEGLFVLGVPDKKAPSGFRTWDLPLDDAMAYIEQQYIANFDDRWNWVTCVWLNLTESGKSLALKLEHADDQ